MYKFSFLADFQNQVLFVISWYICHFARFTFSKYVYLYNSLMKHLFGHLGCQRYFLFQIYYNTVDCVKIMWKYLLLYPRGILSAYSIFIVYHIKIISKIVQKNIEYCFGKKSFWQSYYKSRLLKSYFPIAYLPKWKFP